MDEWGGPLELAWAPADARSAAGGEARGASVRQTRLVDILKRELIPGLVEARPKAARVAMAQRVAPANPEALARFLARGQIAEAREVITARFASGASASAVIFEDLAPAARKLGDYWRDDECDFVDVTVATAALRNMMRDATPDEPSLSNDAPSIMISTAPGETHDFGADIVCSVFRQAGWRTARCAFAQGIAALKRKSFDVAGFSLICDRYVDGLGQAIVEARKVSRNPRLAILVGGPVFASMPGLGTRLGADVCVADTDIAPLFPSTILRALRL